MQTSRFVALPLLLLLFVGGCNQPVAEGGGSGSGSGGASSSGGSGGSSSGGACGGCPSGQSCCGTACRDLQSDSANCGHCGIVCPAGQLCQGGACGPSPCLSGATCAAGTACCGSQCCGGPQVCCSVSAGAATWACYDADAGCPAGCTGPQCPISSRRYKKDIAYLGEADRAKLEDELLRLPLATFRYKSEPETAQARLGFMVEDATSPACVAAPGDRVDLYGYATMAVAALQEQEKEIRALRAELERLKGRLPAGPSNRSRAGGGGLGGAADRSR